ncbi:hypothetical protein Tco_0799959 [Tanacetum coccineum]|uniref:Uncharacterized protein n=1 Tax=Tanacetum coccineum TaxID=301880 RepID=A0ABQ4ZUN2_9ASTR
MPHARPSLASLLRVPKLRCDNRRCHNQLLVFDAFDRRQIKDVSPDTREQSVQPVMTREEEDGISVALDPQEDGISTLSSGFCVSTEWEVVFLGGTMLAEVILVKGHELPTIVKVLPVGFHLSPTSVNT